MTVPEILIRNEVNFVDLTDLGNGFFTCRIGNGKRPKLRNLTLITNDRYLGQVGRTHGWRKQHTPAKLSVWSDGTPGSLNSIEGWFATQTEAENALLLFGLKLGDLM